MTTVVRTVVGPRGDPGKNAYEQAVSLGFFKGTFTEWIDSLKGERGSDGRTAYEVAVELGFDGTADEWLKALESAVPGPQGPIGPMPQHEWRGTELRFQLTPERWGNYVDLKGDPGNDGISRLFGGGGGGGSGSSVGLFSLNTAGIVPGPTAPDISSLFVLSAAGTWVAQTGGGVAGPPGSGVIYISKQNAAVDTLVKGTLVYGVNALQMDRAIANNATKKAVMSMVSDTSIASGASGNTIVSGLVTMLTSEWDALLGTVGGLVPEANYFLSNSVPGQMTLDAPTSGWIVLVGIAINSTDFFVRIEPSIKL